MVSKHYREQRNKRERFIKKYLNGDGKIIDTFIVDKGHKNGPERHEITENGIIIIYNASSGELITKIIAREGQLKRYYKNTGREPPSWLLSLCRWHTQLNYNR